MEGSEEGRKEEVWHAFGKTKPYCIAIPDRLCRLNLGTVNYSVLTDKGGLRRGRACPSSMR